MGKSIRSRFVVFLAVLFACGLALAQQPEVSYSDEFQSYGSPKNPPGWVDTAIGSSTPVAGGLFKTWPDPTQGNKASNIVFGSKSSSGKPEGDHPRMGHFSTLTTKTFSASGRFEYRGRFIRTSADSRIGFTFLSSYPEQDKYYLIGLWSVPNSSSLTMQLFGFGAGTVAGTTNSNFTPAINTWYRFLINVDDAGGATKIRARFWADGATEPSDFSIDATDAAATRLTSGRIGIWAAVKGANYVDDLFAKSPVDHTAPVITFSEGNMALPPNVVTPIGHDALVDVHATDDLSGVASLTATRNGEPYVPLTPIATEGQHTIAAVAVDNVGNTSTAQTTVLVDKTPPVITLTAGGSALPLPVAYFNSAAAIAISATDAWTGATVTATLDGAPYTSGTPISAPGAHYLTVNAVDGVQNAAEPVQAKIVIDTGAPVIEFFEKEIALTSPAKFNFDPAIEVRIGDDSPILTSTVTLDGLAWKSLDPVPAGWHDIAVLPKDAAGNESAATLRVLVDKDRPVVVLTAGGVVLDPAQTAKYKDRVAIDVSITDATLVDAKTTILLDGQPYTPLTEITTEGNPHTLAVHAEDEAGNVADVTLAVVVDSTPPVIVFSANGAELDPRELQKFRADAVIAISVTDAFSSVPAYEATLVTGTTSAPFTSATPITVEARHELRVIARDDVGNTAEVALRILVDKTPPAIAFSAAGQPLDTANETPFKTPVAIDVAITDALTASPARTIRLNGADYESGTPITTDGHHVVTVHAEDEAGNFADAEVKVLVDQTPPVIAFLANGVQLDPAKRNDFKVLQAIEIRVEDALSASSYQATLDGAPYTSGTPLAEGHHTLVVRAKDAPPLENASEATLSLFVDVTPPVVVLRNAETHAPLAATGEIFGKPLTVEIDIQDASTERDVVALLDGVPTELLTISDYGQHTLTVTVTDELAWSTTVTSAFIIDTKAPVVTVTEGTTPLVDGASFTRDVVINVNAEDITTATVTATVDGAPYTPGTPYTHDGSHVLVVNAVDTPGNQAPTITRTFHIDRNAPEVVLRANGAPLVPGTPFAADVTFAVDVVSATDTTRVATIDGAPYTLGTLYTAEGHHHIKVVVTNLASLSTTVEADFTIDKTPPTLSLFATEGTAFTDAMQFAADFTPFTVADDNLAKPPDVVVLLNGQALAPSTAVTEERQHSISATATDKAGNATSVGPFAFVLDKTPPDVTVKVDGEPLVDGALFNKAITPAIEAEDLTEYTFDITLDGAAYTRGTVIEADGDHALIVKVKDALQNERALDPLHFTIDKTPPVVRIIDKQTNADFTGGQFKRPLDLKVEVVDETATITTATLLDRTPEPDRESPWASEQQISSDGHYTLKVTVTDEAGWVTVVPPVDFTIDQAAPVIAVTESGQPIATRTIFNRDATPKIDVQDTTATTVEARLDGAAFVSETPVTQEAWHTLTVKATDALGFVTELLPIEFAVDKTPPVVTVTEQGVPFLDNVNLDHDAAPHVAVSDVTAYTIETKVDGQPFALGSLVTAEGPHTFDVAVTDAANWKTTVPTIHFVVDKTAPVVTVSETETGGPLESGDEFGVTIAPFVRVTDITATTVVARLNGSSYTPSTPIEADGNYVLEVTVTDAVGRVTVVPPIAFIIDKTAPVVQVLERGQTFASGTKLNRGAELSTHIDDLTATTTDAKIGTTAFTFPGTFAEDGHHTLTVTVTDHLGHATIVPPVAFTIDRTPPVVSITVDGQPLQSGDAFNRPSVRPELNIQDTTATTVVATLNGAPYTFGTDITGEGKYTLDVEVTDELGWKTAVPAIVFFIDRTPPVVKLMEGDNDLIDGLWFNRDVAPRAVVSDTTSYQTTATLAKDGGAAQPYVLETAITEEGRYTLSVSVKDKVGLQTDVPPVTFTIDKTSPVITVLYPAANAELTTPQVVVVGDADDAITVTINETIDTTIDATEKKYSSIVPVDLLEGDNALTVVGVDRAGNSTTITQIVRLDTRAPELAITAPAANACLTTPAIAVAGTVGDPNVAGIRVSVSPGSASAIDATLSADRRTWTASIAFPSEGKFVVSATARDNGGHESVASVQVSIDSTKPRIEITEGGVPFVAPFVNRPIAPLVRAVDADPKTALTVTLDGAPYVSGTPIVAEKDYELKASATDCAGNKSDDVAVRFTIDRTPPQFVSIAPANGAVVGEITQVSGTVSPDTVSVVVEATGAAAAVTNGTFAFPSLPIAEGRNAFSFVAIDRAGNATRLDYSFRVKSSAPTVEIVENGSAIAAGARYTRPVTVDIRSNEPDATITATHNGQPFTSGTTISENGSHTIGATARDTFGHTSSREVTFSIDSAGPVVTITEPLDGASVTADRIRVRGTVTGDPVSALINGANLPLTAGAFDAEVALELGPNSITVVAFDAAGNAGQATVDVTRGSGALGLILHTPTNNTLTNRRTTTVAGQVLTPAGITHVTVNGTAVPVDAAGAFRKTDFALAEGTNTITATVSKGEASGSVSVTVTGDFTPPAVTIRESGKLLEEEERFATQAVLTVEATDGGQAMTPQILLDASAATSPMTVTASGGHTIIATAQDGAGNEKRVERTFFIGTAGAAGCALSDFDPADGSVVTTNTITLVGRTGGAAGVKVNGTAATVSNGTFTALVNLSADGPNTVTVNCTDAAGNDTGTPKTLTLTRVTGAPSIDITAPADHSATASETVTVTGTIAGDVVKVVVNGAAATVTGTTFTAANVRLAPGINTITARAYNPAGLVTTDSIRITRLADLPRISITSPTAVFMTSAATIDVSGTWTNLDPASITVTGGASASTVQPTTLSDTTGTFVAASVALAAGPQTITVRGTDRLGRAVTATAEITRADGLPTIAITQPADNSYFGASAGAKVTVNGSFTSSSGATIEVNGVAATVDANASTFTAQVDFSTIPGGLTPVVARITEPDNDSAVDAIRVTKLGDAPAVTQVFPEAGATNVDPGTLPLVLFSAPMDRASVRNAFSLKNAAGTIVNGDVTLERDVLVFAPAVLLTSGETYTIRIAAGAQDLGGNALAADFTSTFTVALTAPPTAPSLGAYPSRVCESIDLTGTAPAGAQLRFELGTLKFNTYASASGAFSYRVPLSGRSGFQVVRVRVIGSDGSLSPAAEAHFEVDCAGPQVVHSTVDRTANVVSITFSKAIDLATVTVGETGSVRLQLADGTFVSGTASSSTPSVVSIAPAQSLATATFTLSVTTAVKDTNGVALTSPHSRTFSLGDELPDDGSGYIAGEVFDAETGRPLPGALISIDVPTAAFARGVASEGIATTTTVTAVADNRGRYVRALPEGAHTIRASADGYTTVWRQIIVRAGQGIIPTDIRLTPRGPKTTGTGAAVVITHGGTGAKPLSRALELRIPAGVVATGSEVAVTSLGAQSLPGLLPLGWSPIASAEIVSNTAPLSGAELTFDVPQALSGASRALTAVRYHEDRDEWRVLVPAVNVAADGKATVPVSTPGAFALVYPDQSPLQEPPPPMMSSVLTGVADPCATGDCPPLVAKNALELTPPAVLPTQRTVGTLSIDGSGAAKFPSGTAVQAYVDEELHLADGTRDLVSPFVTDLLLYRNLAGDTGVAEFHLAPSARAAEVVLEVGYDHIRIVPYPERVDRGALIGPEGGRVPADELVAVEIPAAATTEALKATATSIRDFAPFGTIAGYRIVGGLSLSLQWASAAQESSPVELLKPARATFTVNDANLPSQLILVEVLEGTPYGRVFRLASQITALEGGTRFSTKPIDRAVLPVDGIIREGTYLLLAPEAPIAFATGTVHIGDNGPASGDARVLTPGLGVVDVTRLTGIFNVPVPATAFMLVPRTNALGDGIPYQHASAPAIDAVVNIGDLALTAQPPAVVSTSPANNATGVGVAAFVQVTFSRDIDPASASIIVSDARGTVSVSGPVVTWKLATGELFEPNTRYTVTVAPTTRALNGAALGEAHVFSFTTVGQVTSGEVHAEKIRITIPDAASNSRIIGDPGALPGLGWSAVPVRRGIDFASRPTANAAADGSFSMTVAGVTIADQIDLRVVNTAGAVAAIIPLTPFTSEDGRGFVARPGVETHYTTADNITLSVPAGAFEVATLVRIEPAQKSAIVDVPGFDEELVFHAGFKIDFEGIARKRIDLTFPTPATLAEGQSIYLGRYGISARGPRIMLADLLRRDGTNLTTHHPVGTTVRMGGVSSNAIVNPTVLRDMLLGIDRASIMVGFSFQTAVNFVSFAPPPVRLDFFIPPIKSMYYASFAAERDRILVPIPMALPFHIVGVDPGSGLTVVDAPFDARPPDLPGEVGEVSLPGTNDVGPYPVFVSPGRAHVLDINADSFEDESIRNLIVKYDGASAVARVRNAAAALPDHTRVEILNLRKGVIFANDDFTVVGGPGVALPDVQVGDRLVFLIGNHDVDPAASAITVVFSEPIFVDESQEVLRKQFKLLIADDPAAATPSFKPVTGLTNIVIKNDSGKRRITIDYPGGLKRGGRYRLELSDDIRDLDGTAPLRLAQVKGGKPARLSFDFTVREPKGPLTAFNIPSGSVRDLALSGNILLVSALDAGILVYDVSNPAALKDAVPAGGTSPVPPQPIAVIPPPIGSTGQTWALATDQHGRFYATALSNMYGVVRSYRIEDFHCTAPPCTVDPSVVQKGNAIITWRTGINVGVPLSSLLIGGWPEATPRKMQIVTKDSEPEIQTFPPDPAPTTPGGPVPGSLGNGFRTHTVTVEPQLGVQYDKQRVTVTNVTRNYSWSKDIDGATDISIIGKAGDQIRVVRNISTIGVVSLFGHGVGVYDLNAVEANSRHLGDANWQRFNDTLTLDTGDGGQCGPNTPCDKGALALTGESCPISDLWLSPDASLGHVGNALGVFALSQNRGIAQLTVEPQLIDPANPDAPNVSCSRAGSLVLAERIVSASASGWAGHPRLNRLRRLYREAKGADPYPRYTSIATYRRYDAKTNEETMYALVAGYEYGLLVAKVDDAKGLRRESLVDVVWIPSGANSVRVMQEEELAIVVDGRGRVLLVNLALIDESGKVGSDNPGCSNAFVCEWPLFPTVEACLTPIPPPPGSPAGTPPAPVPNNAEGLGFPDPRIVWASEPGLVKGTLAPVFDPETGFIYTGNVLEKTMRVFSAVDPRIRFLAANPAGPAPLRETDRVIPLGIAPPKAAADGVPPPANVRAAFQVVMSLPGSMAESMSGTAGIAVAVESELVPGAAAAQTPSYLPPSHLRRTSRSGQIDLRSTSFVLQHDAPADPDPKLRFQRGWNRMVSKWIVAVADPRAMDGYDWGGSLTPQQKEDRGCFTCERPSYVTGTLGTDWFELYTAGRAIAVRPEICSAPGAAGCAGSGTIFTGTDYAYLGDATRRLERRVSTVMADTVRPTHVLTAANGAPAAVGSHQETFFVHSGEVMTGTVDLDAGGRAGWNVTLDRTWRSRTLGLTPLGAGWDSSMFRRLRELPTGDVEYRDGSGEVWLFRILANAGSFAGPTPDGAPLGSTLIGTYTSPVGLDLKLSRQRFGWRMRDAKQRITDFDEYGRLAMEADEFHNLTADTGNVIVYSYDADGLLRRIVDPVGRTTKLTYEDGRLTAEDWRGRKVVFHVEPATGLLTHVDLPPTTRGYLGFVHNVRTQSYSYLASSGALTDRLELGTNLEHIQEPGDTESRVTFAYETTGGKRDMVKSETWHTSDNAGATFAYTLPSGSDDLPVATEAVVRDALNQKRTYTLTATAPKNYFDDRVHAERIVEADVPVWEAAEFGALPASVTQASYGNTPKERAWTFGYVDGRLDNTKVAIGSNVLVETKTPWSGINESTDKTFAVVKTRDVTSPVATGLSQAFEYDGAFLVSVQSDLLKVETPEAHREELKPSSSDGGVKEEQHFDKHGRLETVTASPDTAGAVGAGPATTAAVSGAGATTTIDPYSDSDEKLHRRGMPERIASGTTLSIETRFEYPDPYQVKAGRTGRDYDTTTEYDETGNVIRVAVKGTGVDSEEIYAYDARGRMVRQRTKQSEGRFVEERYEYDRVGRMTRHETWETGITPSPGALQATTTDYNLPNRETVTTLPDGGTVTATVDGLGRVQDRVTDPKQPAYATFMTERTRYDIHGNVVFRGDDLTASATRYDAAHRPVETLDSAGIRTTMKLDGFGRLTNVHRTDTGFDLANKFTPGGKLESTKTNSSETTYAWDGAGRTRAATSKPGSGAPDTVTNLEYDDAGRLRKETFGAGSADAVTQLFGGTTYHYAGGLSDQPSSITSSENGFIDAYQQTPSFDALTRPTVVTTSSAPDMTIDQSYDAMGNVTSSKTPSMPGTMEFSHDARGLVTEEKKPAIASGSPAVTKLGYSPSGVLESYTDPTGEPTKTTLDGLGRPVRRDYADFTFEEIHYTQHRVTKVRDRQGRTQEFLYDSAGRLDRVLGSGGVLLDDLDYDDKGRLVSWRTPESRLEFSGHDPEGRPAGTKQIRLRADGTAIDEYSQSHTWDGFGRRTSWSMPGGGALTAGWTSLVQQQYDAAGNLIRLDRSGAGGASTLLTADYRAPGRPKHRTLNTAAGVELRREYDYEPNAGRLDAFRVFSGPTLMAGSEVTSYEGTLLKGVRLLGLANGERTTSWEYDAWGRLKASAAASNDANAAALLAPNTILPKLSDADFLEEVAKSGAAAPAKTFAESGTGHKIANAGNPAKPFEYKKADGTDGGSVRTGDEHYLYEFDEKERLRKVTQRPTGGESSLLRVVYTYSGLGRMIGRRVEIANAAGTTVPADSAFRLATPLEFGPDAGLPPETTFVWDPIADRMVAIFDTATGQPLRQFLHGGMGLDDPVEVTVAGAGGPAHYYPIFDEAGDGGLQAILDQSGKIVTRTIMDDPYGDGEIALSGAAVEKVTVTKTDADGVNVDVTLTEPIDSATLAAGVRLTALTNANPPAVAATTAVIPALAGDGRLVRWSLSAAEWTALATAPGAHSLSIAVTDALRATTYTSAAPVMPANTTLRSGVYATAAVPFELRESFTQLATRLSTTTPYDAYELTSLTSTSPTAFGSAGATLSTNAADSGASLLMVASFQAQSFTDPLTLKNYVRNRWYDPSTGTFLSPDPLGYVDSANLYAFAGGDPVNRRDPTGNLGLPPIFSPEAMEAAWKEAGSAVKNFAIGALKKAGKQAQALDRLAREDMNPRGKYSLDALAANVSRAVWNNAERATTGPPGSHNRNTPSGMTQNMIAWRAHDASEELAEGTSRFLKADKETQQQMIGGATLVVAEMAAPFSRFKAAGLTTPLLRGTSEGFAGGPVAVRFGITSTTPDPLVAALFATRAETEFGRGVVHIATRSELRGVSLAEANVLSHVEDEVALSMQPVAFAELAGVTITAGQARAILRDMGFQVPTRIRNELFDAALQDAMATRLTPQQVDEFIRRATAVRQ